MTSLLNTILTEIRDEHGDRVMVLKPGERIDAGATLPDLIVIAAVNEPPTAFDAPSLSRALDAAKHFHHEEHSEFLGRGRLASVVDDYLAGRLDWGCQPLRPCGPTVILVTETGEPDNWVDAWEQAGVAVFCGRALLQDLNDASRAVKTGRADSIDEALGVFGWQVADPKDWPF